MILYGPRQVGKTTLAKSIISSWPGRVLQISADEAIYMDVLSSKDAVKLRSLIAGYDLLFIDEAQRVPDIGMNLKILHDQMPEVHILVTGSSSFDLANSVSEPLTGRSWTYNLHPISIQELSTLYNKFELDAQIDQRLIFGSYPELLSIDNQMDKIDYLYEVGNAYLYKDILELSTVRNSAKIRDLLRLIAFQVGSEVSLSELGSTLGISKDTVYSYIDLLQKSFVLFKLSGFSRNLRKEVSRNDKVYFYDLGIRNMLIDNFKPIDARDDVGALWENFLIVERMKKLTYSRTHARTYYWRTYTGAEIDYIEEREGILYAYEFKASQKTAKCPTTWAQTYPDSQFEVVNRNSYFNFLT